MTEEEKADSANGEAGNPDAPEISDGKAAQDPEREGIEEALSRLYRQSTNPVTVAICDIFEKMGALLTNTYPEKELQRISVETIHKDSGRRKQKWADSIREVHRRIKKKSGATYGDACSELGWKAKSRLSDIANNKGAELTVRELFELADFYRVEPMELIGEETELESMLLNFYRELPAEEQADIISIAGHFYLHATEKLLGADGEQPAVKG